MLTNMLNIFDHKIPQTGQRYNWEMLTHGTTTHIGRHINVCDIYKQ